MGKPRLRLVAPATVFGAVDFSHPPRSKKQAEAIARSLEPPRKRKNVDVRAREYLTEEEVEKLIKAAAYSRYAIRDQTMILLGFRHGLRSIELVRLRWDSINFERSEMHVGRAKAGKPGTHPVSGREMRMLRKLQRDQKPASSFVFTSERKGPFSTRSYRQMVERLGVAAGFDFPVHTHMLRHACGYKLANDGHPTRSLQDYLGHRNIQHTVRYTELAPTKFRGFWKD